MNKRDRQTMKESIADLKWAANQALGLPACPADGEALYINSGTWRCPKCGRPYTGDEVWRMKQRNGKESDKTGNNAR